jgi:hypothetical protein
MTENTTPNQDGAKRNLADDCRKVKERKTQLSVKAVIGQTDVNFESIDFFGLFEISAIGGSNAVDLNCPVFPFEEVRIYEGSTLDC